MSLNMSDFEMEEEYEHKKKVNGNGNENKDKDQNKNKKKNKNSLNSVQMTYPFSSSPPPLFLSKNSLLCPKLGFPLIWIKSLDWVVILLKY